MKIVFGSDRNGLEYKEKLIQHAKGLEIEIIDVGTYDFVPCDSPYYALKAATCIIEKKCDFGVLICGTGTGMNIAANKVSGIMCGVGYSDEATRLMREHNNANMIAFGQDHMGYKDVQKRFDIFISTPFSGLKHQELRIQQIHDIEAKKPIELSPILNPDWK